MNTIILDSRAWLNNIFPPLHNYLHEYPENGIRPIIVFHNKIEFEQNKTNFDFEILTDYWEEGSIYYSEKDLEELERKYNYTNLFSMIISDRYLFSKKYDFVLKQISFYFYAWEKIFSKYKPQYYINEAITGFWNYAAFAICDKLEIQYLEYLPTKTTGKYYFTRDIYGAFPKLEKKFFEKLDQPLNTYDVEMAEKFIDSFVNKPIQPECMKISTKLPKIHNFFNIYRITINIFKDINLFLKARQDYKIDYRLNGYYINFIRLVRINRIKFISPFEFPKEDEKYIFYPLHFQPEATTDIWAAVYRDQIRTIELISRSLPFGYKLYVKEHSAVLGSKSMNYYKKISSIPNVKLIHPNANTIELIKKASVVAVLTGTVGLEAIFLKKPVIVFGKVFYDIYPNIIKVENPNDLNKLINNAIFNFVFNEELFFKFISSYISVGYQTSLYQKKYNLDLIRNIANELKQEFDK